MKDEKMLLHKLYEELVKLQKEIISSNLKLLVILEGRDAAGKGGAIRKITENLDPRGIRVHPIGPPTVEEKGNHYLLRFWRDLPEPGMIAIFDRSW